MSFKNVIIPENPFDAPSDEATRRCVHRLRTSFGAEFDRRERSGDHGDDIIGWLLNTEVDGRTINRDELHGICNLLMIAGLDTVAASLSCILSHLARNPERRGSSSPSPSSAERIEELMRFESPVTQGFRHVVEDVELPSGTMTAGTNAIVWWAGPTSTPTPSTTVVDPPRPFAERAHLLREWLASVPRVAPRWMELRAAIDVWHQRIPDYRIPGDAELVYSVNPRAPHHLPLVWDVGSA